MIKRSIKIQFIQSIREGMTLSEVSDSLSISLATAKYIAREIWREMKTNSPQLEMMERVP